MLPAHIHELLREQIEVDLHTKGTALRRLQTRAAEKAQSTGMIGNVATFFVRGYMEEIEFRITLVTAAIRIVLSEVRLRPYEGLTQDLLDVFDSACATILNEFQPRLSDALKSAGFGKGDAGTQADIEKYLTEHRMNIKRLSASILEPARQGEQTTISINNSQVGLVQAGSNLNGAGSVDISNEDISELRQALQSLRQILAQHPEFDPTRRGEVVEVVQEIEREIAKPSPNKTKTGGLLSSVMASIKGISDIDKAAQVLMKVAEQLGYHLRF